MSSKMFQRKLKALEFPIWNKFNINNMEHIKTLVVYLEQTKIRELTVSQRAGLKKTKDAKWMSHFGDYLDDIEDCPYQITKNMQTKDWIEIIEWYIHTLYTYVHTANHIIRRLISCAIQRTYSDAKDDYNRVQPIRRVEKREYALSGCMSQDCEKAMNALCNHLNIPPNKNKVITAQTLYHFIKTKFSLSSIQNYEACIADTSKFKNVMNSKRDKDMLRKKYGQKHDPWQNVKNMDDVLRFYGKNGHMANYLGFTTGNKAVDAAAIILRVLYVADVRSSQNQLNEIVTFLQRFTANPKTNANLGKVGR